MNIDGHFVSTETNRAEKKMEFNRSVKNVWLIVQLLALDHPWKETKIRFKPFLGFGFALFHSICTFDACHNEFIHIWSRFFFVCARIEG